MVVFLHDETSASAAAAVSAQRTPWLFRLAMLLAVLVLAAVAWGGYFRTLEPPADTMAPLAVAPQAPADSANNAGDTPAATPALRPLAGGSQGAAVVAPQTFAQWLEHSSSLRGAALDGAWGALDAQGQLQPSLAVRRRFDQLLTLLGERPVQEISGYIAAQSAAELGVAGGKQVHSIWQRYLALQQEPLRSTVVLSDRSTWPAAQAERQAQRVRHLGPQWAKAFFEAEEQAFAALMLDPPAAGPPPLIDAATLTPQQRARWLDAQAETARWQQRLDAAHSHWQALARQPQLSDVQRQSQMATYLQGQFDAQEQRRVKAVLNLPM
jgi:lipase chaperone LimK